MSTTNPVDDFLEGFKEQPQSIVGLLVDTVKESCEQLRSRVANVRYGAPGTILFEFKGLTYAAPEPLDVMPVGYGEASQSWALKQILSGTAKVSPNDADE